MFILGGLGTISSPSHSVLATESSMLIIYYAGFCFGWAAIGHTITAEIPSSRKFCRQRGIFFADVRDRQPRCNLCCRDYCECCDAIHRRLHASVPLVCA